MIAGGTRYWPDIDLQPILKNVAQAADRERAWFFQTNPSAGRLPAAHYLAISGGGDDGAFGAGLLIGWTARGDRPVFKVVTGISTGALVAPFAFLGPQYDNVLEAVCSHIDRRDIFRSRGLAAILTGESLTDDTPLAHLLEKYITPAVLRDIAREYAKGRLLFIGTTDLDVRQAVVWDMGAIASSGDPGAIDLFRKVVLASASIPGIFPPVMIDVKLADKQYQEMHVDGAVTKQVFLFPAQFIPALQSANPLNERERHMYIILNGRIDAEWQTVTRRTSTVAGRAVSAMLQRQAVDDLFHLQMVAEQDGIDFNVAYIDDKFAYPRKRSFAADYMQRLFRYSMDEAVTGISWRKSLPRDEWPSVNSVAAQASVWH